MKKSIVALAILVFVTSPVHAVHPGSLPGELRSVLRLAPVYTDARVLAANTAETVTVPTFNDTRPLAAVVFSATCASFYVNANATATVPAGDVTDGSASERNPSGYQFAQGDTFSVVTPDTCTITMAWYYGNR